MLFFSLHNLFRIKPLLITAFVGLMLAGAFPLSPAPTVYAMASADLISDVIGYPTSAQVGETFTFFIRYRCASSTVDCEQIEVRADLPDLLDIISVDPGSPKLTTTTNGDDPQEDDNNSDGLQDVEILLQTVTSGDPTLCNNTANDVCFTAGETAIATIVARIHPEAYDPNPATEYIDLTVTSTSNVNDTPTSDTTTITPGIEIEESDAYYGVTKTRTSPGTATINPIPGENVTYNITVAPTQNVDNVALADFDLVDTLPANATFVSATNGGTHSGGSPGGVVTWSGLSNAFNGNQLESVTVSVTVSYPADETYIATPPNTDPDDYNRVEYTINTFNDGRTCPANCTGDDRLLPEFDAPTSNPGMSKSIVGNPVGIDGTGRFNLSINNTDSNVAITLDTFTDILPIITPANTRPLEVEEIRVGSRDVNLYTSDDVTCDETTATSSFTPVTGNPQVADSTVTPTAGNNIVCVRWDWPNNTLESGERIDGMQIVFTPRTGVAIEGANYENCAINEFDGPDPADMTLTPPFIPQDRTQCATANIAATNTNINIAPSKSAPAKIEPDETGTFSLNFEVTERSAAGTTINGGTIVEALPNSFDTSTISVTISDPDDDLTQAQEDFILNTQTLNNEVVPGDTDARNVLRWRLPDGTTVDPVAGGTPPALVVPTTGGIRFSIVVTAKLFQYTEAAPDYENIAFFLLNNADDDLVCEIGTPSADGGDLDGDGNLTENFCQVIEQYEVPATAILRGQKWIRNESDWDNNTNKADVEQPIDVINNTAVTCDDGWLISGQTADGLDDDAEPPDNIFSRFPCAVEGVPGNEFVYSLTIQNVGNTNLSNYELIDVLPYNNDTEVLPITGGGFRPRESEWRPRIMSGGITLSTISGAPSPPGTIIRDTAASALTLTGNPIDVAGDVIIEYSTSNNPCRFDITTGCDAPAWTTTPADWAEVRSFRIRANDTLADPQVIRPGDRIEFTVRMEIPTDETDPVDAPLAGEIIWNSYAHTGESDTTGNPGLIAAEPIKVGIRIPETVSVGNYVWNDANNNGVFDPGTGTNPNEALLAGVTLTLYEDTTGNGTPDSPVDVDPTTAGVQPYTVTTDANGYYIFNMEQPDQDYSPDYPAYVEGREYMVVVDAGNFTGGNPLENFINSTGVGTGDTNDKGVDVFQAGIGYASAPFEFDPGNFPTGELATTTDEGTPSTSGAFGGLGQGALGQDDDNSNLEIDFGFYQPMSLGNRVWFDIGADTDSNNLPDSASEPGEDDGIENQTSPDESGNGVGGVTLELYVDNDNIDDNDLPTGATPIATTITDPDGYYLFDNLNEGRYVVVIPPTEFDDPGDPLFGYDDSTPDNDANNDTDRNDDGVLPGNQATVGERSNTITLTNGGEPTTEADQGFPDSSHTPPPPDFTVRNPNIPPGPNGFGRFGELDVNSNLTLDFAFWQSNNPANMELGNFVWDDENNNSQYDTAESPIDNVTVNLYADDDKDGTIAGAELTSIDATTATNSAGYYVFTGLEPGSYIVELAPSNWASGGALENYVSSERDETIDGPTGTAPPYVYPGDWDDQFDDGLNRATYADYAADGIRSDVVSLLRESEAPGTDPNLDGDNNETTNPAPATDPDPTDGDTTEPHLGAITADKDTDSDLTVDFGVYVPLSLGNRIWSDSYGDGTGTIVPGDGEFDQVNESGIDGVDVQLYRLNNGGTATNLADYTQIATDTTANGGYYLFDDLLPGTYRVRVPRNEFAGGTLNNHISSDGLLGADGAPGPNDENVDHGVDDNTRNPEANDGLNDGIWSLPIELDRNGNNGQEPTTEGDNNSGNDGPAGRGDLVNTDAQNDNTVDLGFYVPPQSIGNRVWYDINENGTRDPSEDGIENVTVQLYDDNNILITDTTTDANGYYIFDNLPPGEYYVQIPADQFDPGNALEGLVSTVDGSLTDDNTDDNDDGGDFNGGGDGNSEEPGSIDSPAVPIRSALITLSRDGEITTETDKGPDGDGRYGEDENESNLSIDFGFTAENVSIGNFVWIDSNNNREYDPGTTNPNEQIAAGVSVTLYLDADTDGIPDAGEIVQTDDGNDYTVTTDANGYYIFNLEPPGVDFDAVYPSYDASAEYIVVVDDANFTGGGPLVNHISSTGAGTTGDTEDRGQDDYVSTIGYASAPFTISANNAPTNEIGTGNEGDEGTPSTGGAFGPNGFGELEQDDNSSDLEFDFGFYQPLSLGNRVWFDMGPGAGETNDGNENTSENNTVAGSGVAGVEIRLFDSDDNPVTDPVNGGNYTTTTDANGYYLFDGLGENDYYIVIPPSEFDDPADPLFGYEDSDPAPGTNTDQDDDGTDPSLQSVNGETSETIELRVGGGFLAGGAEVDSTIPTVTPVTFDLPPDENGGTEYGRFRETDTNSYLLLDLGFYKPQMALGNFVWDDENNDSQYDPGELPIDNVIVNLYFDADNSGALNGAETTAIATTDTDASGYYLFDGLEPGSYIVELAPQNWDSSAVLAGYTTGVLENYISSSRDQTIDGPTGTPPYTFPGEWDDQFDDGLNRATYAAYAANGIRSDIVTLITESEAPGTDGNTPDTTDPNPAGEDTEPHTDTNIGAGGKDTNSDLTVDFGVYVPLSLGNRVWRDDYGDGTGAIVPGDGEFDLANELGIDDVDVELYRLNNGGTATNLTDYSQIATDTTANGGYYLFDGLTPGTYRVRVPQAEFEASGTLVDHISSDDDPLGSDDPLGEDTTTDASDDNDDHGIGDSNRDPETDGGVWSIPIELERSGNTGAEPTTEGDNNSGNDGPEGRGDLVNTDAQNDNTVDMGFYIPPHSIGNRVWYDTNANGIIDGAEAGIEGVTVNLLDDNGNPVDDPTQPGTQDYITQTDANGYYLFQNLPPGDYIVEIPAAEFDTADDGDGIGTTGELVDLISTFDGPQADQGAANIDNNDNGFNDNGSGGIEPEQPGSIEATPTAIRSQVITLSRDDEPTTEAATDRGVDTDGDTDIDTDDNGFYGEDDNDSDFSVDFGFFQPVAVGNVIWQDEGPAAEFNNGLYDTANENGIENVTLTLYVDNDNNGLPDDLDSSGGPTLDDAYDADPVTPGVQRYTATTNADGYYIFDGLPPGNYLVAVDASNFGGVLENYVSSNGVANPNNDTDNDDNGRDDINATFGVLLSDTMNNVILSNGGEPTTETAANKGPDGDGRNRETDDSSNLTVDGGFYRPLSLGNRVWLDTNADGNQNGVEPGIENVTVQLYDDTDTLRGTATTDASGYYRFDRLRPGDYYVQIPAAEFASGDLTGLISTLTPEADPNTNGDENDNGLDDPDPTVNGIRTALITLSYDSEPTGEDEPGTYGGTSRPDPQDTADDFANMTLDLGFVEPVAVGNRVWRDTNGNGTRDPSEPGIDNVTVELYDTTDTLIATVTTDNDGYYRFDNLVPGDYYVQIPAAEFGVSGDLVDYLPVAGNPDPDANDSDTDDNGDDNITDGVRSETFTLEAVSNEPTTEADSPAGNNYGNGGTPGTLPVEADDRENLTVDMGFFIPVALGNRVWDDTNNDGLQNGVEPGIDDVTVNLLDSGDNLVATVTTDNGGYYRFDNLVPGDYYVQIPGAEFASGELIGYRSSTGASESGTPDNNIDQDDNSTNRANVADLIANGLRTPTITLQPDTTLEPTGETDTPAGNNYGNGGTPNDDPAELDNRENLTLDIGVYRRVAVGNFIWEDANNNGLFDTGESGIDDVTVNLLDSGGNPVDDPNNPGNPYTTTTNADGYYIFDNLMPGDYYVQVPATEFNTGGDLIGYRSSDGASANGDDDDANENGQDSTDPTADGVRTDTFTLDYGLQPTGESGQRTADYGGPWTDADVDLTRDLSFVRPVSIGNQVWYDTNNNSTIDGSEVGIGGITVELYRDADNNGSIDGGETTAIATTTTTADGFYLFTRDGTDNAGDLLLPGDYAVGIPSSNFATATDPLFGYYSSATTIDAAGDRSETAAPDPDNDTDNDDNGTTQIGTPFYDGGVLSDLITVNFTEPTNEDSPTSAADDGANNGTTPGLTDINPNNQSNVTVDFGFYTTSLGNRIFIDADNSGDFNAGDTPVPDGTLVELLASDGSTLDLDGDGNPAAVTATTTGGVYSFTGLPQGDYIVRLASSNFDTATDPLFGYVSSTGTNQEADPDTRGDENDNGLDTSTPATDGIPTATFTQQPGINPGTGYTFDNADGSTTNDTVDLGLVMFDLALTKVRDTAVPIQPGDKVTFTITVFNQGVIPAYDITVTDYVPSDMTFVAGDNTGWTGPTTGPITATIPQINPGNSDTLTLILTIDPTYDGGTIVNYAEISAATELDGQPPIISDRDSTPDNTNQNGPGENANLVDDDTSGDALNNPGDDEDDHDPAEVPVTVYDLGDLPDTGAGTGTGNYQTRRANGGPIHELVTDFRIGALWDSELDGQPNTDANGDDTNGDTPDDEDGVTFPAQFIAGRDATVAVDINNPTGGDVYLNGFIDWNADGDFDDPGETIASGAITTAGASTQNLIFPVPANTEVENVYARFRLSQSADLGANGNSVTDGIPTGEVEDYVVNNIVRYDWGDLPDDGSGAGNTYPTNEADGGEGVGPSHQIVDGYYMGARVDAEGDGQPNATADADDNNDTLGAADGQDDEDGVTFPANITAGQTIDITVNVTDPDGPGAGDPNYVIGYIDWNADGDWNDASEIVQGTVTGSGTVTLTYNVPLDAATSGIGARFRLSETDNLPATGPATEGEVEDYLLTVEPVYRVGNLVWIDTNNNGTAEAGEPGIANVDVRLYQSDNTFVTTTTTDANGKYSFDELPAGDYFILIPDGQTELDNLLPGEVNVVADPDPATEADNDNNGDTVQTVGAQTGLTSGVFTLGPDNSEPTNEQNRTDDATDDDNTTGVLDTRSNYTVDVAYVYEYRLGNFVWDDLDRDATRDAGEPGIAGVVVNLYDAGDNPVGTTTTDADGFYSFDGLLPGDYYAAIEYEQTPIRGYISSPGGSTTPNDNTDNDDNGVTDITAPFTGVRSNNVTLGPDNDEPTNETNTATSADDDNDTFPDDQSHYALDFGLYLTYDWGDNPDSYSTTEASNGPRHPLQDPLRLGPTVDDEIDANTPLDATGDDTTDSPDDEDGVNIPTLTAGETSIIDITVNNSTGQNAFVQGWIDFNGDGDFDDIVDGISERIAINENIGTASGTINLSVDVPPSAVTGATTYARFRVSTSNTLGNQGEAPDGEVEDYALTIQPAADPVYDYGDAPDDGTDDNGTDDYDTIDASGNPARHELGSGIRLGSSVDDETDGQPNANADGDDTNNDDEDSVTFPTLITGQTVDLNIAVNNPTATNAFVQVFIDWNGDGDWNDTGEQVGTNVSVPANSSTPLVLPVSVPAGATVGDTYARLRISTTNGLGADGTAPDGEVEDYRVTVAGTEYDWGDAPDDDTTPLYPTNNTDGNGEGVGPSHLLGSGLILGSIVDAEADGQPVANNDPATGDDSNDTLGPDDGQDDEDGITIPSLIVGQTATISAVVNNPTSNTAYLQGWIDWNDDGDFNDPGEQIASNVAINPTTSETRTLTVNVPATAVTGQTTYARFRLSTVNGLGVTGEAPNGEVEDYEVTVQPAATLYDYGDAPDTAAGVGAGNYETLDGDNGPRHELGSGLVLGNIVDDDDGTLQNTAADADDTNGTDDEDSVTFPTLPPGGTITVSVNVDNPLTTDNAYVQGWIDFNGNGIFDASEQIATNVLVPAGSNTPLSLTFNVPAGATPGDTYARLRISTQQDLLSSGATPAPDGEVEDHRVTIGNVEYDYGDNPDADDGTNYPTNDNDGGEGSGARHQLGTGLVLGSIVDADPDGQPTANATGDDTDGTDDEDGVTFPTLVENQNASISVVVNNPTSNTAYLQGWIDWNDDGDFDDPGEQIAANVPIANNTNPTLPLNVTVPTTADGLVTGTPLHTRFRLSTDQNIPVGGDAPNGEVEDYTVTVQAAGTPVYDYGDAPDSYATDDNDSGEGPGARHQLGTGLVIGSVVDDEPDGQPATPGDPATRDDLQAQNDEDGVTLPTFTAGTPAAVSVQVNNPTGDTAYVQGWIDWNGDGDFDDPGEQIATDIVVPAGSSLPVTVNPVVPTVADGVVIGTRTYARFRISTTNGLGSNDTAPDGEVEDYDLTINAPDFDRGDLPDTGPGTGPGNYNTTNADNGPAHIIVDNLRLGVEIDAENNGAPTANADGDDTTDTPDDEDGVDHPTFTAGATVPVGVQVFNNTGGPALLQGWIDWNGDGDFDDPDEYVAEDVSIPDGTNAQVDVPVTVPATVTNGTTYARWRISTDDLNAPTGNATNGEVEDYLVTTAAPGISVVKDDGQNAIIAGSTTTYTVTITNSNPADTDTNPATATRTFIDNIPVSNPNGYDASTVSWTCTATGGASCQNPDSATAGGNPWQINEDIIVPFGGQVVFEIVATLYPDHQPGQIINEAIVQPDNIRDRDENGIIYDPPTGNKVGVLAGANVIEWRLNWINSASLVAQNVTITDPIPAGQTYVPGSLNCIPRGVTTVTTCQYDPVQNRVIYVGSMGPDGPGTPDGGVDDSLDIVFRVSVPGAGTYQNQATLTVNSGANAGATVVSASAIDTTDPNAAPPPPPGPEIQDPAIVKFGDPAFALPGEEITWTIEVSNPNDVPIDFVRFTDSVPGVLEVLGVNTPSGVTADTNGNNIAFTIRTLAANQTVAVQIRTRLPGQLDEPFVVNTVVLGDTTAQATVTVVGELPATGEQPWWYVWAVGGAIIIVVGGAGGSIMIRRRHP